MKTEDIKKMAQAWKEVQEASKKEVEELTAAQKKLPPALQAAIKKKEGEETKEAMDPVDPKELKGKHKDRKDKDINNDGKVDSTDKYLHARRKAVSKAVKKDQEVEVQTSEATVNELKKSTLSSYIKKASGNMAGKTAVQVAKVSSSNSKPDPDLKRGLVNRMKGIGRAADKLAKESVEEAATHKPGVASPAGEGLSPSAKKELARKTPMPDFVNEPKIDKKTFDSMRASGKKAKARGGDNQGGDKNIINKPMDVTAKASKKEDDGFKDS